MNEIDTTNYRGVTYSTNQEKPIQVLWPRQQMTREEAINFSAWLVFMADDSENYERFHKMLEALEDL